MNRVLLAYLPYNEDSVAVETAIGKWLANPANLEYFDKGKPLTWVMTGNAVIVGTDPRGNPTKMVASAVIIFDGTIEL